MIQVIDNNDKKNYTLRDLKVGDLFKFKNNSYYNHDLFLFIREGLAFDFSLNTTYAYYDMAEKVLNQEVIKYDGVITIKEI